jgi:hypothetical protein
MTVKDKAAARLATIVAKVRTLARAKEAARRTAANPRKPNNILPSKVPLVIKITKGNLCFRSELFVL